MIVISIKNDIVLSHIEALPTGAKLSVRGLASELNVSEGTVYKAIKEAEVQGLVITKPKSGTFRVEASSGCEENALTLAEIVSALGVGCICGKKTLGAVINNIIVCDSDEAQLIAQLERCDPAHTLCLVGARPDFQTIILQYKAHMLITGGSRPSDYHIIRAEKNASCILSSLQSTYTVLHLLDNHFSSGMPANGDGPVSEWMQSSAYLYRDDYVADWQRYYEENFSSLRTFPVVDEELNLCGGIDIPLAFAAAHSQKLSTLISDDAHILTLDASCPVRDAARKMMLSGSSFAAVVRGSKLDGIIYSSDLLRYFMYSGASGISDLSSFLVYAPELSTEDRKVYELNIPDTELPDMDILPTVLALSAALKHMALHGCVDYRLCSSSCFYPGRVTENAGLMLCTTLSSSGNGIYAIDAELYSETEEFAKAMFIFAGSNKSQS